jgi:CheY-like chemotaxis protein
MKDRTQVLVAEDEPMLRILVVEMLESAGFKVIEAGDGVEALNLLKGNPDVELLISDIKMPGMDGYTLVDAGLALRPSLKIMLMSGYADVPTPASLKERDVEILHKPFDLDQLCVLAAQMTAKDLVSISAGVSHEVAGN